MNEIQKYTLKTLKSGLFKIADHIFVNELTEFVKYSDVKQLQARIKELESEKHINEIKAQGIYEAIKYIDDNSKFVTDEVSANSLLRYAKQLRTKHD